MGVRVDQAGSDERAAQVLDVVDIDNVVDNARHAGRQLCCRPGPGNSIILDENGSITPYLGTSPQPTDIGKEPETHSSTPCLPTGHRAASHWERTYHIGCVALLH